MRLKHRCPYRILQEFFFFFFFFFFFLLLLLFLNLLNGLGKNIVSEASPSTYRFFPLSFINSIIQKEECKILFII